MEQKVALTSRSETRFSSQTSAVESIINTDIIQAEKASQDIILNDAQRTQTEDNQRNFDDN